MRCPPYLLNIFGPHHYHFAQVSEHCGYTILLLTAGKNVLQALRKSQGGRWRQWQRL